MPSNYPRAPLPLLAILAAPITWLYGRPDLFDSYRLARMGSMHKVAIVARCTKWRWCTPWCTPCCTPWWLTLSAPLCCSVVEPESHDHIPNQLPVDPIISLTALHETRCTCASSFSPQCCARRHCKVLPPRSTAYFAPVSLPIVDQSCSLWLPPSDGR